MDVCQWIILNCVSFLLFAGRNYFRVHLGCYVVSVCVILLRNKIPSGCFAFFLLPIQVWFEHGISFSNGIMNLICNCSKKLKDFPYIVFSSTWFYALLKLWLRSNFKRRGSLSCYTAGSLCFCIYDSFQSV
jgi:hypothetical protein